MANEIRNISIGGTTYPIDAVPVAGGTFTGAITIGNGTDFSLQAGSTTANDPGDIVFRGYTGAEIGRIWLDPAKEKFMLRYGSSDSSKVILHSGNSSVTGSTGSTIVKQMTVKINDISYTIVDTNTTYTGGTGLILNGTQFNLQTANASSVNLGGMRSLISITGGVTAAPTTLTVVNPPIVYPTADGISAGTRNYPVITDRTGAAFVFVPWSDSNTTYSAGTGLTMSDTTINHSNSITAGMAGYTYSTSGATFTIPYVKYDAQGHVTAVGTRYHSLPTSLVKGYTYSASLPLVFVNSVSTSTTTYAAKYLYTDTVNSVYYNPSTNALTCAGGFYESSDETLKDFSDDIKIDLNKISDLRKSYFTWKEHPEKGLQIGMSAQEVQKLYPELVTTGDDEKLTLAYDKLSVVALAAIDSLHKENLKLKKNEVILEERVKLLEKRLENLINKLEE